MLRHSYVNIESHSPYKNKNIEQILASSILDTLKAIRNQEKR